MYNDKNEICSKNNCSIPAIRETLKAIKECVNYERDIVEFNVILVITLIDGLNYDVNISPNTLNNILIHEKIIVIGKTTIPICKIAKIKVLTSQIYNERFEKHLNSKLYEIAKGLCKHNEDFDYFALTSDDNKSVYKKIKNSYEKDIEECTSLKITTDAVISNLNATFTTIPVVTSIVTSDTTVLNNIFINPISIVTDINPITSTVLKDISTKTTTVVDNINFLDKVKVVTDIIP